MLTHPVKLCTRLYWIEDMMLPELLISGCPATLMMSANCWEQLLRAAVFLHSMSLSDLIASLDKLLSETDAEDWPGRVQWLE
jgi:hypothetical protein